MPLVVVFGLAACGSTAHPGLRIFDPSGRATPVVTTADVLAASPRVLRRPNGSAVLFLRLTRAGALRFQALTRALSRRGARIERPQPFALEVGGKVYARPLVDYRIFPGGMDATAGLQIAGLRLDTARKLVAAIRQG
jgi:hypothetical protein